MNNLKESFTIMHETNRTLKMTILCSKISNKNNTKNLIAVPYLLHQYCTMHLDLKILVRY